MYMTTIHDDDDDDDDESIELVLAHSYNSKNSHECANRDVLWQTVQFLVHARKRMADDSSIATPTASSMLTVLQQRSCEVR